MSIPLQHFKLVATIVKKGTLTKAAEELHLTQSALSHQLKELEKELGVSIFDRRGKKLQLSEMGARFLLSAEKILAELEDLEKDIQNMKSGELGSLRITTQCYTAYHWLPRIITEYKHSSPAIDIHIVSAITQPIEESLLKGELDVGIIRTRPVNPLVKYEPLFKDQLVAIMSPDHPLAFKKSIRIADLEGEEIFLHLANMSTGPINIIEGMMQEQQVKANHIHRIHYTDAIVEMINANMGISIMADWIVQHYLESRNIIAKPMAREVPGRTWYAATCKKNIVIDRFLDCLKLHFSELDIKLEGKRPNLYMYA